MQISQEISIRPMRDSDFRFVQKLASEVAGYTIPPDYVLWMLGRCHPDLCVVAELRNAGPVAYMLALAADQPKHGMFIWQFAATLRGVRRQAPAALAKYVRRIAHVRGIRRIIFTTVPGSGALKTIEALAQTYFGVGLRKSRSVCKTPSVTIPEYEYCLVVPKQ